MSKHNSSSEKQYDISFFHERNMRAFLSRFYHSIVQSGENAQEMMDIDLDDFAPKNIAGDKDTQNSMKDILRRLDYVRVFFKNDDLFDSQIMDPIRIASDLRKQFANFKGGKRSSSVEGLVFARSRQSDEIDGDSVTLSMICPELQSVMSIRVSNDSISENNGWMEFEKVQPIVLVNRLHPTPGSKTKINQLEKKKDLFEFNFIFSSIRDLDSFSKSLEMENFSEMSSIQSDKRRHLGCTFVSFGKVTHFDEQDITIESLLTGDEFELTVASRNFKKNSPNHIPEDIVGKTVAFLGTTWYEIRGKDDIRMDLPELLDLQICDDEFLLKVSEVVGYVRQRRKSSAHILKNDLKIDDKGFEEICAHLEKSSSIRITGNKTSLELLYETESISEPVKSAYVKSLEAIRRLREKARTADGTPVTQETLVDKSKTNSEGMIRQLYFDCKLHEKIGCKIRLKVLKAVGTYQEASKDGVEVYKLLKMFTDRFHSEEIIRSQLWFLKNIVEFIDRKNKKIFLTNNGEKILAKIREKESKEFLRNAGEIVELLTIPEHIHIPSLIKYLENPGNQFSPFEKGSTRTKVFWTKTNSQTTEIIKNKVDNYLKICREILSLMLTKGYPINSEKILEDLTKRGIRIKMPVLEILLDDIVEGTGRIRKRGGFYEYVFEARITDFFENNKEGYFTIPEIMENTGIQKIDNSMPQPHNSVTVRKILLVLERLGVIVSYYSNETERWTSSENPKEIRKRENPSQHNDEELGETIHHQVFSILNQSRTINRNELEDTINAIVGDLKFSISVNDLKNKISEMISEIISNEQLFSDGYTVSISRSFR